MNQKKQKNNDIVSNENRYDETGRERVRIQSCKDLSNFFLNTIKKTVTAMYIDVCHGIVNFFNLFRADPVETLHSILPAAHSEINIRTVRRLFVYLISIFFGYKFLTILDRDIWFELPEIEEFAGKRYCPAFGNEERCERNYYQAYEGLILLVLMTFMHYLSCIQGAKLNRGTFFRINAFQTILSLMQCVRWRVIHIDVWWSILDTGAFRHAPSDDAPSVMVGIYALLTFGSVSLVAFLNYCDMIRKFQESKTQGWELE